TAVAKKMSVFALTEHMPRHEADFYPEEKAGPYRTTFEGLLQNERAYFREAARLRHKYAAANGISMPIGFESDWIREGPGGSLDLIERSLRLREATGSSYT